MIEQAALEKQTFENNSHIHIHVYSTVVEEDNPPGIIFLKTYTFNYFGHLV